MACSSGELHAICFLPDIREYQTARLVVAICEVESSTQFRLAKLGRIPYISVEIVLSNRDIRFHDSSVWCILHVVNPM